MRIRNSRQAPVARLDDTDKSILEILRVNGRATNLEVAERLSISAATVSARIARLEKAKAMRVVAVSDFSAHDLNVLIAVGIKVRGRTPHQVGIDIAALPEVLSVNVMMGACDLELLVGLHTFDEVKRFMFDKVATIPGVSSAELGIAADIVKFDFNLAPL